ncbi:CaiB/BaiF CoA-transferase family protein [Streptomyces sp. DH37]|uniref:CaiB/BaiF CoA transferase family protein n=1 Tax=Streptomyces sp. DH37 TaxID=3040122 RepID=UPI0024421B68|nr:CaiB/BaiF CoA-transferase family protein [Streptomyces sp. DH37]MDG9706404.1 CaiB/BaiF CoA-transferase family protein [Streptomyces sp. DH37]
MGPLRGLRIVEIAAIGPAPFACMMLADLGADVVRVDRADGARSFGDWHRVLDRGRRSVALDLKSPRAVEALLRLVEGADVLVEGFRPGVAERLGIGPERCAEVNPGLVYARMTGWGQRGPLASAPGHDINYIALSGALHAIGPADGPPVPPVNLLGDFAGGGLLLVCGILAALHERRTSGLGQVVDAAIVDGTAATLGMLMGMAAAGRWSDERGRNLLDGGAPFYGVYRCSDHRHVAVGALEERFFSALLEGLGLDAEEFGDRFDPRNWPRLRERLAARFATRTRDEWAARFSDSEACVSPVLTVSEAAAHPHHRARGTYLADGGAWQPAPAPRFARTAPGRPRPAPRPGEHTREVLLECGLRPEEIDGLTAAEPD